MGPQVGAEGGQGGDGHDGIVRSRHRCGLVFPPVHRWAVGATRATSVTACAHLRPEVPHPPPRPVRALPVPCVRPPLRQRLGLRAPRGLWMGRQLRRGNELDGPCSRLTARAVPRQIELLAVPRALAAHPVHLSVRLRNGRTAHVHVQAQLPLRRNLLRRPVPGENKWELGIYLISSRTGTYDTPTHLKCQHPEAATTPPLADERKETCSSTHTTTLNRAM